MFALKQLVELGVKEFVICAGARNLRLIEYLSKIEGVTLWPHFEERSAGFFALGRTALTGEPCGIVCTSGTAVAELLPAVIEAFYQGRPLVVVSADRPIRYRGTGAPQAIEQEDIFSSYVESCYDFTEEDLDLEIQWLGTQPLHVNVCLEESGGAGGCDTSVGFFHPAKKTINVAPLVKFLENTWDGLVVAVGGLEPEEREEVYHFVRTLDVPVIVDATSGLREALAQLNLATPESVVIGKKVGKILRIGDVPVGRFWRDLETTSEIEVLSVCRTGFSGLARESTVLEGEITRILKGMGEPDPIGDVMDVLVDNQRSWSRCDELLEKYPDSEPGMVKVLSHYATLSEQLFLGNSLPIREWNQFCQREIPIEFIHANRGANGIDGQIATWLGWTAEHENSWAILGDLTTMYDMSSLALLDQASLEGRVLVVINNFGGRIFDRVSSVTDMPKEVREKVVNQHSWDFSHLAAMWNMSYTKIQDASCIEIEPQEKPLLIELCPSASQTEAFWNEFSKI